MSDAVYVQGTGMTRFDRTPNRRVPDLGAEAVFSALDDAGLSIADIQAVYCGNIMEAGQTPGQRIMQQVGQTGVPVVNVTNACATGATALREAWAAIRAGLHDVCLAVGVEKMGAGLLGWGEPETIHTEGLLGSDLMPALFAHAGSVHSARYGTSFEQFARVAVKNHQHAVHNPLARYRKETPLEEVMNAEMIAYPLTKLMCSVNVDGAAAAVLVSARKARELGMSRSVRIRASALTSDPYSERNLTMPDFDTCTTNAANQAYEMAGVGPRDLDLIELHDCFATAELMHYENLGLCPRGEAGRLIDDGDTWAGGRIPVNLSGGLLSKGHPIGATGIANIHELTLHLRGEAGARQQAGARLGLAHVIGLGSCCAIHILEAPNK
ncbi:MAG: thiolase family protein [Gammaproteobacteria bacterium]|jgi:acetyl-CoA acetyltransferase|nr:thiolase family protein [Gammaproteobacteria bacterium]MBP6053142.1 lipid-transfer protein [Pseudomonadales bacterium]MBK7169212.1 thiolase family protein [Gammaproteobacteria bacterium]MBK7730796.1 thiolase family protein [Gammaproteobacteria bacterium]MBK8306339.1 thiolase family protein [Gammaproteobacteria bacterium]